MNVLALTGLRQKEGEAFLKEQPLGETAFQGGEHTGQREQSRDKLGVLTMRVDSSVPHCRRLVCKGPGAAATGQARVLSFLCPKVDENCRVLTRRRVMC